MRNQRRNHSIFEVSLFVLSCVVMVVGVCSCKKEQPIREDTSSIEAVEQEPSIESVSSEDKLSKQTKIIYTTVKYRNRNEYCEIYIMNADGSDQKKLTDDYADMSLDYSPLPQFFPWSPDGSKIAFISLREDSPDICLVNADGSEKKNLTNSPDDDGYPSWSPDGKKIAFHSDREGSVQIYVIDIDGKEAQRLTYDSENAGPCWSPDGKRIVSISSRDGDSDIYVMNADGSKQKRLTDDSTYTGFPLWSPDGKKIAFRARGSDAGRFDLNEIHVINVDGSEEIKIAEGLPKEGPTYNNYCWSPDGSKIAFHADKEGNRDIYTVNADGSALVNLTNNPAIDATPSWSPDGSKIAFASDRDGNCEIYIMNSDGSEQKRLTNNSDLDYFPCWSPFLSTESLSSKDNLFSQSHKTVFEGRETTTVGGEPIIVVNEVIWRIVEPEDWRKVLETFRFATEEELLRSRVRNTQNKVIGRHFFSEFINPDPNKIQIPQIEQEMLTDMQQSVSDSSLGIEIEKVFIKQIMLSEEVQKRYNEMVELLRKHGAKE